MITLPEAKQYLHITPGDADDDAALSGMIEAAVQHLASIGVVVDPDAGPIPAPLKQAALMLVAHFFNGVGVAGEEPPAFPITFFRLVAPYREIEL